MPERQEIKQHIGLIWMGVAIALIGVAFTAVRLNQTITAESEAAFEKNISFLADSSAKSIQLFMDGVISEIVLLTEIDAVKQYKAKEADIAFRGVISKHKELISHMILLNDAGKVEVMVTKDPDPYRMKDKIDRFFKETIAGWKVNISKELFESETYHSIAIGMPIFRKVEQPSGTVAPSGIYASGMIMALIGIDDLVTRFVDPVRSGKPGFSWLLTEGGDLISNTTERDIFIKQLYGPIGDENTFKDEFIKVMNGETVAGWRVKGDSHKNIDIAFGDEKWLVSTAKIDVSEKGWTMAVAAPLSEATHLLNKSFMQSVVLFIFVVIILLFGGSMMLELNRRRVRAEEKALHTLELEEKNKTLNELNLRIDEFLAIVSHDIRSPLNVIRGFVKVIQSSPSGSVFKRETDTMLRSSNRLMQLVNDILDVSKLEAGKVKLSLHRMAIDDVIIESVKTMEFAVAEKNQEIKVELGDKTNMKGDSIKLLQVMNNLLGNAIKFTPKGGVISVKKTLRNGNIIISVTDTGPGIPTDQQGAVFDKFEQIKHHQQGIEPGSGLGLTICKNIVDLHGGHIGVESEYGKGSIFTITIPLNEKPEETKQIKLS
ncbi:hypothetical protein MNBD_NITROSPINAE01-1355 [hydrothermal vent metagenome]|uniref:histidine kinase n=1 Tax=hydrothermal vent metagenome TaxID=652676 RepID=A0A3B1BX15_9ZZZZ